MRFHASDQSRTMNLTRLPLKLSSSASLHELAIGQSQKPREAPMFGRVSYTWDLMRASWNVLKRDKGLLVFPLLSGICCLLVLASFAVPIFLSHAWEPPTKNAGAAKQVAYYGTLFLYYFANYFVITFFNVGIVACAIERMRGGEPTVGYGFSVAMSRLPLIIGWSLLSATVGLLLRIIEESSSKAGEFVAGLIG